jgi:hypothetical protein
MDRKTRAENAGGGMSSRTRTAVWLSLAIMPVWAHAQIYVCKDANGRTMTSDRPIPECAARPMRELGNNGVTRREIAAPLTAAQKHQREIEADRLRSEAEAALEVRRRDLAMLERFRSEGEINAARKRAIEDIQENIKRETVTLALAEKSLKEAQVESEGRKGKNGVALLPTRRFEEAKATVASQNDLIREQKSNLLKVDIWFDETLKRYRELNGAVAGQ